MTFIYRQFESLLIGCILLASAGTATALIIGPDEMRGLRNGPVTDGATLLLGFSAVKPVTEDRTIAHFDISSLTGRVLSATLNVGTNNIDDRAPDGTLDVYAFTGDGSVSIDEWAVGSLFHTFTGIDGRIQTLMIDIESLLNTAILTGDSYLSFNFRTTSSDRFSLNSTIEGVTSPISGEGPTFLDVQTVPEPTSITLICFGLAGIGFIRMRRVFS